MAEYIEREALLEDMTTTVLPMDAQRLYLAMRGKVRNAPSADVVEVVRCKDCEHRYVPTRCALWYGTADDTEYFVERGDDFYCSYGVAKMDGKENNYEKNPNVV